MWSLWVCVSWTSLQETWAGLFHYSSTPLWSPSPLQYWWSTHPSTHTNTAGVPSSRLSIYTPIFTESLLLLLSVLFYLQQVIRWYLKTLNCIQGPHSACPDMWVSLGVKTKVVYPKHCKEVMSLTFLLRSPGSSGLSHFCTDRFLSVLLLDRQRDDGNVWKFLSPPGSVLFNEHLGDPGGETRRPQNIVWPGIVLSNKLD